jgi:branched-chain amino acid transport system permease protein
MAGSFLRRHAVALVLFAALALLPIVAPMLGMGYLVTLGARMMIFAIAALSLDLLIGFGAMVSFGHAAFLGLGGYAFGILASHGHDSLFVTLPAALVLCAVFALLTGAIAVRTSGAYFIMITLAFGQMAFFVGASLAPYGGDDGLTIYNRATVGGAKLFENNTVFFYAVLACLLGSYLLLKLIVASRFGRVLAGVMQNPQRMEAIGYRPYAFQLTAYVIAGTVCGLAGFLLANQAEFVAPAYMSWQRSGELIVMVILGGAGTLHGAIIGAIGLLALENWLSGLTEHWKVILGPLIILVALFARGGLMGLIGKLRR